MIFLPPSPIVTSPRFSVFLAGSIEMGKAIEWQDDLSETLDKRGYDVYNPRRKDWNSSWTQSINNPQFREQVEWELDGLDRADYTIFYFQPGTMSPISLMELGLQCGRRKPCYVICPEGFWRKGNVDIICAKYHVEQFNSFEELKDIF